MKKLLSIILCCVITFSLIGCRAIEPVVVNVDGQSNLSNNVLGANGMIRISDGLWYDAATRIVYWWNGDLSHQWATTPSPYYAPNGLPYLYNPKTNTFEEIN